MRFDMGTQTRHHYIAPQFMQSHVTEDEPRHGAALFRDRTEPIGSLTRVPATGRQAPVFRQTHRPRKPLDRADPRRQRQTAVRRAAWNRRHHGGRRIFGLTLFYLQLQLRNLFVPQAPLRQQQIHLHAVHHTERQCGKPFSHPFRIEAIDFVDRSRTKLAQAFSQHRQLPVFGLALSWRLYATNAFDHLPRQQPMPVDPQQAAELVDVASIGFSFGSCFGLNQDRFTGIGEHWQ